MKFTVGYQLTDDDRFMQELLASRERIAEVYFSYGKMPNGRHAADFAARLPSYEAKRRTDEDLAVLSQAGIAFNLLLNGNCYGAESLSRAFFTEVCEMVDEVGERFGLSSVTTTSPDLAELVKRNFPSLEVRASVNMEIGSPEGVDYLADIFDGFYLARELNRELPRLRSLSGHVRAIGRKPYILANSGCLRHCSARQYHDNLVSHEREIMARDNAVRFESICGSYFKAKGDPALYLSRLSFIRPEDLSLYEGIADAVKLATRVSASPARVLRAYTEGKYVGNLLDLLEPNHAGAFYPRVLDNRDLPADFGQVTANCTHQCASCGYCARAAAGALRSLTDDVTVDTGDCDGSCHGN